MPPTEHQIWPDIPLEPGCLQTGQQQQVRATLMVQDLSLLVSWNFMSFSPLRNSRIRSCSFSSLLVWSVANKLYKTTGRFFDTLIKNKQKLWSDSVSKECGIRITTGKALWTICRGKAQEPPCAPPRRGKVTQVHPGLTGLERSLWSPWPVYWF